LKKIVKFLRIIIILLSIFLILFKIIDIDKIVMKKIYPLKYTEYVEKYSKEYNIDSYMIYAILKAESNFDEKAKSNSNAIGLMQILESTAIETGNKINVTITEEQLYQAELNIQIGTKYFSELLDKYNNNYKMAIIAYNAGSGNVDKWIKEGIIKEDGTDLENVPFKETNNYVRKILRNYEIYKELYEWIVREKGACPQIPSQLILLY